MDNLFFDKTTSPQSYSRLWIGDDADVVRTALANGYNPNYNDNDGATAVHRAAECGCVKVMEVLLAHEITRVDVRDHMQLTILHYAAKCRNFENAVAITNMLLDHGLEIDARSNDIDMPTALFIAIQNHNIQLATLLLERGANVNTISFQDFTPLMFLMDQRRFYQDPELEELVAMLLYYNVDVNYPYNIHVFYLCLSSRKQFLIDMMVYYFDGYDFLELSEGGPRDSHRYSLDTMFYCLMEPAQDVKIILYIIDKLKFTTDALIESMLHSTELSDSSVFYALYKRLDRTAITKKAHLLNIYFIANEFNKHDFIDTLTILLNLGINWRRRNFLSCHYAIADEFKKKLELTFDEVSLLLYQTFIVSEEVDLNVLLMLHEALGFCDEFELFLKFGVKVRAVDLESFERYDDQREFARQLFFPAYQPERTQVGSLLRLSRDAVRKYIQPQVSLNDYFVKGELVNYFKYYSSLLSLSVPKSLIDVLTLRRKIV